MEIILFIVLLVWMIVINNRVSDLQKKIRSLTQSPSNAKSPVSASAAPLTVQSIAEKATVASPVVEKPIKMETETSVTSEEASGRFLGKLGIAALVAGAAFFLKYAFDEGWIGPVGIIMLGVIVGIVLLALGQSLRKKYLRYSDLLMGGGVAILYLSIFAAHTLYHLISQPVALFVMFAITILSFAISIINATMTFAMVGVIGGFATPLIISLGTPGMIGLFSYITLLNVGVFAVSIYKKWIPLNYVAFVITMINFLAWYDKFYQEAYMVPVIFFLTITFVLYIIASLVYNVVNKIKAVPLDYGLIGLNAIAYSGFLYSILEPKYGDYLGFIFVILAVVYLVVAFLANKLNPEDKGLNIYLPGITVVFLSIAVPLQLDGPWVAVAWLVESVVLYFLAAKIANRGFQVMGLIVYILGLLNVLTQYVDINRIFGFGGASEAFVPVFNKYFALGVLSIAVSYIIAYIYRSYGSISTDIQKRGVMVFLVLSQVITLGVGTIEIAKTFDQKIDQERSQYVAESSMRVEYDNALYNENSPSPSPTDQMYRNIASFRNQENTVISFFWALYAGVLLALGFTKPSVVARRFAIVLFCITALKVFIDIWNLGPLYRIVSSIVFGILALAASFAYAKYKHRLKEIV
ncbi:MAG: DUF2339 domain-containing protein [Patescibacteria group bacterium]